MLLQVVFQAEIAREAGLFDINDVVRSITEKLVRRHPHVFGEDAVDTADQVVERWEEIKAREKADKGQEETAGLLESIPRSQPALLEAFEVGKKAAKRGFDWQHLEDLKHKVDEEMGEIAAAAESGNADDLEDEVGDLLFMAVNVARYLKVHPEIALRRANAKFRSRFAHIERSLAALDRTLNEASLDEMEALWQQAKGD